MEFTGRYLIPAPPEAVWAAITDLAILKACIPGCKSVEKTSPTEFAATLVLKIGPVKTAFKGKVTQAEADPPHRCVLRGEGQGTFAGFAKGEAEVVLTPQAGGTAFAYTVNASLGGKLADIGRRLVDGAARRIADGFFARFSAAIPAAHISTATPVVDGVLEQEIYEAPPSDTPTMTAASEISARQGLAPEIWVVGLIGVIAILLLLFGLVL
jgi:hypothetical protein